MTIGGQISVRDALLTASFFDVIDDDEMLFYMMPIRQNLFSYFGNIPDSV